MTAISKKIWILQTGEPVHTDSNYRPMRAINLSNELVALGHEVTILTSSFFHQEKKHRSKRFKTQIVSDKLKIKFIPSPGYRKNISVGRIIDHIVLAFNLYKLIISTKDLPDIAFIGYPPVETAFIFSNWLRKKKIPYYVDLKDQWPHIFLEPFPSSLHKLIKIILYPYFYMGKASLAHSSGYVSMSSGYIDWMKDFSGQSKRSLVAPLTVKRSQKNGGTSQELLTWLSDHDIDFRHNRRFCFIGSFMSVFDFSPISDAIKELNSANYNFEVIMCGDGGFYEEIRREFSFFKNVKFTGWINEEQIRMIYKLSRASLVPYKNIDNYTINTPNKVVDAFANERPIITSLYGEVANICKEYNAGFSCNPQTNICFFEAMKRLLDDDNLVHSMQKNAADIYRKKFLFEKVYESLAEFIIDARP